MPNVTFDRHSDGIQCAIYAASPDGTPVGYIHYDKWVPEYVVVGLYRNGAVISTARVRREAPWVSRGVLVTRAKNVIRNHAKGL
jgi:hypothetical protein